jgi:hypothetical protein
MKSVKKRKKITKTKDHFATLPEFGLIKNPGQLQGLRIFFKT